jgi:hypothetical protein
VPRVSKPKKRRHQLERRCAGSCGSGELGTGPGLGGFLGGVSRLRSGVSHGVEFGNSLHQGHEQGIFSLKAFIVGRVDHPKARVQGEFIEPRHIVRRIKTSVRPVVYKP